MTGKRPPETPLSRRDMFAQGAGLTLTLAMATAAASSAEAATPVERFSVKDFGAVGDGRTDDTAAIDRAITAAMQARSGIVEIPPGTYSIKELWLGDKSDGRRPSVTG